jgi:hypothetical protein
MTQARSPDGKDAFMVIAERLTAVARPVESVMQIRDKLPCGDEFALFAGALGIAINAYDAYLQADLRATQMAAARAVIDAKDAGASTMEH